VGTGTARRKTHLAGNGALVGGLALDGEGDTVGGLGLDLEVGWSWLVGLFVIGDIIAAGTNRGWRGRSPC
jgi:hypothetical protein